MTHTILGINGQIGQELAKCLHHEFRVPLRVVSRKPSAVNPSDEVVAADLLSPEQTLKAVEGSEVVYLTAGLPMDTQLWIEQWPTLMNNVIAACKTHGAKLVFFDNTYMYPQTDEPQTETTAFSPNGGKGKVRAQIANQLLLEMGNKNIEALICRAPEFYGPGKTQSITNATVIDSLKARKKAKVFLRDDTRRTLIFTPDASRAMALLGNTPDAFGQTWHLPCDDNRPTYKEFIAKAAKALNAPNKYIILRAWQLKLAGKFKPQIRDAAELLPRYQQDNIFVSTKFKQRFPSFKVTTIEEGLNVIASETQ